MSNEKSVSTGVQMQKAEGGKFVNGAEPKAKPPVKRESLLDRWVRWRDNVVYSIVADD